jgi:hypothetical protein
MHSMAGKEHKCGADGDDCRQYLATFRKAAHVDRGFPRDLSVADFVHANRLRAKAESRSESSAGLFASGAFSTSTTGATGNASYRYHGHTVDLIRIAENPAD